MSPLLPTAYSLRPKASPRRALTLIEMLVSLAVTLVMMAAVVNLFANLTGSIRNRRAVIEVSGQLRQVRQRMALDLAGATCEGRTWIRPGENRGYIEHIEDRYSDAFPSRLTDGVNDPGANNLELGYATSLVPSAGDPAIVIPGSTRTPVVGDVTNGGGLGDWDDVLALTVRSESDPFVAQVFNPVSNNVETIESMLAEVVWYAGENDADNPTTTQNEAAGGEPGMRRIYRRVYLIAPWLGPWPVNRRPDNVSVRYTPASGGEPERWVANTLGDLTKREYRASRGNASNFPHGLNNGMLNSDSEYLVLGEALAFDVRVFDPGAPLYDAAPGTTLQPGDAYWPVAATKTGAVASGYGAYCDLGWGFDNISGSVIYPKAALAAGVPTPVFNMPRAVGFHPVSKNVTGTPAVYDTWSYHYENDGINQDESAPNGWQATTTDQGANGFDDDNQNGVDDMGERETSPPYDVPLRGVQVKFRVYERDARQIREASVTHSFAP